MSKPTIEGPLGQPPFERPSIAKAITNFVLYKFGHSAQRVCCNLQQFHKEDILNLIGHI